MNKIEQEKLNEIAKSYDKAIELGKKGIDSYTNFPEYITEHKYYHLFEKMKNEGILSDSARVEIKEFLNPQTGMKFVDLGCCLNLMFGGYDKWQSSYYGVDISLDTIELLKFFANKQNLKDCELVCCSMNETPYEDNYFDIASCIGSLEYFKTEFVTSCIKEAARIIKQQGRYVLDIPRLASPEFEISSLIEEYQGRPDEFDMTIDEFEHLISTYFKIINKEEVGPMIQYFLIKK